MTQGKKSWSSDSLIWTGDLGPAQVTLTVYTQFLWKNENKLTVSCTQKRFVVH